MKISNKQYQELYNFEYFVYELKIFSENSNDERMQELCKKLFDTTY